MWYLFVSNYFYLFWVDVLLGFCVYGLWVCWFGLIVTVYLLCGCCFLFIYKFEMNACMVYIRLVFVVLVGWLCGLCLVCFIWWLVVVVLRLMCCLLVIVGVWFTLCLCYGFYFLWCLLVFDCRVCACGVLGLV